MAEPAPGPRRSSNASSILSSRRRARRRPASDSWRRRVVVFLMRAIASVTNSGPVTRSGRAADTRGRDSCTSRTGHRPCVSVADRAGPRDTAHEALHLHGVGPGHAQCLFREGHLLPGRRERRARLGVGGACVDDSRVGLDDSATGPRDRCSGLDDGGVGRVDRRRSHRDRRWCRRHRCGRHR